MSYLTAALVVVVVAQAAVIAHMAWLSRLQHGSMANLAPSERIVRELLTAFERNITAVVAGLHDDINGLREEVRRAVQLPPESRVPDIAAELQRLRIGELLRTVVLIALVIVVGLLAAERVEDLYQISYLVGLR